MIFYLKNRMPHLYRDVVDHNHTGDVGVTDKAQDPRALAMALLAVMREAAEAVKQDAATIEHMEAAE